jgi:hypothetical protein
MKMKKRARSDLEMEGGDAPLTLSLAPQAPHQPRPARDAAHTLERGGVESGQGRVQEGARASERDPGAGDSQRCSQE